MPPVVPSTAKDRARQDALTSALLQAGDLDRAVELNLPLADETATRFAGPGLDPDELRQVAALGLVKAAKKFEPDRETSFLAFALRTMTGELTRYLRDHTWLIRVPRSLHEAGTTPAAQEAHAACRTGVPLSELTDHPAQFDPAIHRLETLDFVRSLLSRLSPRARTILVLRYVEEFGQTEIGRLVGVSQAQVCRELQQAIAELRQGTTQGQLFPVARRLPGPRIRATAHS